jgi:RNA polymerase sigma-70 factor, ECF subfamily
MLTNILRRGNGSVSLSTDKLESSKYDHDSDEAIIERIFSSHDSGHFSHIVTRYRDKLTALAKTTLAGSTVHAEFEDVVQDAFLSAYDHLGSFRRGESFRPWLYKIVLNRCLDRLRAGKRIGYVENLDLHLEQSAGPLERVILKDQAARIAAAVSQLPPKLRAAFLLRHLDDLSYAELATVLSVPEGSVKNYLFRARAQVKQLLRDETK